MFINFFFLCTDKSLVIVWRLKIMLDVVGNSFALLVIFNVTNIVVTQNNLKIIVTSI